MRLQDLARNVKEAFSDPPEIVDALTAFEAAIPMVRKIRNPLTHPSDDKRLDDVAWFDSLLRVGSNGSVEYLVDPRYEHHDAAIELSRALSIYLHASTSVGS